MRVLVTGGYGFIGSYVAEKFHKEGHQIYILDNLSTGQASHVKIPHKSYMENIESRKCEQIFASSRFDVVVHMAAHGSSGLSEDNHYQDIRSNVLGLTNMLHLSSKYGVKKFIFASSEHVYGPQSGDKPSGTGIPEDAECRPDTPYGLSKWTGEQYCRQWSKKHGLETLVFRLPTVYGPRQRPDGESAILASLLGQAMKGKELAVPHNGASLYDLIYVEDVAHAIYRASETDVSGVYNLSSNTALSGRDIVEAVRQLHGSSSNSGAVREPNSYACSGYQLDNSRVKRALDWVPMYAFQEGLQRTYEWFRQLPQEAISGRKPAGEEREKLSLLRQLLPYLENALGFLLVGVLTLNSSTEFLTENLDLRLVYILTMGIIYGTRQSIIAFILSTVLYMGDGYWHGRDFISLIYDTDTLSQIAVYLFIAIAVGYSIERKNHTISAQQMELDAGEERYQFLLEIYQDTRSVKDQLQLQIVNSEDSFGKMYSIIKELDSMEPEFIYKSAITAVERIMKTNAISIYSLNRQGSYMRLAAKSNNRSLALPNSLRLEEHAYLSAVINGKDIYVNKEMLPGQPFLAAPVLDKENNVVAVVAVHELPFESVSLYYQNLFKIVCELISSSVSRAFRYMEATQPHRYVEGTAILSEEAFLAVYDAKRQAYEELGTVYTLLRLPVPETGLEAVASQVASLLRETDYVGLGADGSLYILLSNSTAADAGIVIGRLSGKGLVPELFERDLRYA